MKKPYTSSVFGELSLLGLGAPRVPEVRGAVQQVRRRGSHHQKDGRHV